MKKAIIGSFICLAILIGGIIGIYNSQYSNKVYESSKASQVNANAITMMYETNAGSGEYTTSSDSAWLQDGYIFNAELSSCENGSKLTWNDETKQVLLEANISDRCYVYFDKELIKISDLQLSSASAEVCITNVSFNAEFDASKYYLSINGFDNVESYIMGGSYCFANATTNPNELNMYWGNNYSFDIYAEDSSGRVTDVYSGNFNYQNPGGGSIG